MAPDSGYHTSTSDVSTIITCEGTLGHPEFPRQFQKVVDRLNGLLGVPVKVRKLEPWNSVRVTLSVPREAASRLRQLAQQGAPQLRALGILSVQLDGEGAISLRLQGPNGEPQEVILRTTQDGSSTNTSAPFNLGSLLPTASGAASGAGGGGGPSGSSQVQFKSPNVVCPPDTVVPRVGAAMGPPQTAATNTLNVNKPPYAGPFPFASMNQAIHSQSNANPSGGGCSSSGASRSTNMEPPSFLPPPYPGMRQGGNSTVTQANQPAVTISSPLLVNLLQNDLQAGSTSTTTTVANSPTTNKVPELPPPATTAVVRQMRPPPPPPAGVKNQLTPPSPGTPPLLMQQQPPIIKQAASAILSNHAVSSNNNLNISNNSSTMSQSALSTQTSIASIMSGGNANNNIIKNSSGGSVATSTQMAAINSIANSLANAANSIAAAAANSANASYKGPYQQQQQSAAAQQTVVHHYQRTPQGSIIAVHKPPPVPNQSIVQTNSIPIHHQQQQQPQQRPTLPQALLRQQIMSNMPPQKSAPIFVHNNVQLAHNQSRGSIMSHRIIQHNVPNQGMSAGVLGMNQCETVGTQVAQPQPSAPIVKKPLPSPPPYNVAISRNSWDLNATNLLDLAPSLTDLKPDELDDILPTLDTDALPELSELELLGSALGAGSDLCEESGNSNGAASVTSLEENSAEGDGRKFLINPLTGELEAQSGGEEESDTEEVKDVFTGLPSPVGLSDDDTNSTTRPDTMTDQSDSETRSSTEGKHPRVKNSKARREGRDSPAQKPTEKIKLRLKLEKSEPINPAYKVDVSFIHAQQPKKATTSIMPPAASGTSPVGAGGGGVGEELRVPPLHISLRGRNSAVIKNKTKLNPDGTPVAKKPRKTQGKGKKEGGASDEESGEEHKKVKKFKSNHDHKDLLASLSDHSSSPPTNAKYSLQHNHHKDKQQKERRGSDSELVRANSKKQDANGALLSGDDKRRRLSQSEGDKRLEQQQQEEVATGVPSVLGSTNVGTVAVLPQKLRKDKIKLKDTFKIKDNTRKLFAASPKSSLPPSPPDKKPQQQQTIALPTAIDVDMEAKFKQSLMEVVIGEKGIPRPPHRTVEIVGHVQSDGARMGSVGEKVPKSPVDSIQIPQKEKSPEPDKCNEPDKSSSSSSTGMDQEREKQLNAGRSPNSGSSGGQGEDSGIESMDALSEKSPNQASQSPHADILPNVVVAPQIASKTQVPDMLDIEAQLAKMEGLEPHQQQQEEEEEENDTVTNCNTSKPDIKPDRTTEDVNENECVHRSDSKPCCELTCTLQGGLDSEVYKDPSGKTDCDVQAVKNEEEEQPQPPPPTSPALYSFSSNSVDKGGGGGGGHDSRGGSVSPVMTTEDEDSNMGNSQHHHAQANNKSKSLLEQLLIEIPEHHHGNAVAPSSHSPATRSSVRTRAHSKLNSPELSSPVPKNAKSAPATTTAKRKRNESDSSNHSVEDTRKRPRKGSEASDLAKRTITVQQQQQHGTAATIVAAKREKSAKVAGNNAQNDESSDSDEPLIEKVRKTAPKGNNANKGPKGAATPASQLNNKSNTRRSLRAGHQIHQQQQQDKQHQQQQEKPQLLDVKQLPAQNTRSREKVVQNQQQQPLGNNQAAQQQQLQHQHHHQAQNAQHSNAEADALLRRKTRSADVESKRKKEVK